MQISAIYLPIGFNQDSFTKKLKQVFSDAVLKDKAKAEHGLARYAHVNEVVTEVNRVDAAIVSPLKLVSGAILVGRDHAGPGLDSNGEPFYGALDAQKLIKKYENEIGIKMIPFNFMVYLPQKKCYESIEKIKKGDKFETISGTDLRKILEQGKKIPQWFTYPEIAEELRLSKPPLHERGFTVFFTGLSPSRIKALIAVGAV